MRGLPAKAVLERNQTTDEEDRGGSNGSNGDGDGRRNDEVFHFRWGIPERGTEEGVTRLFNDDSHDDVNDDDDDDDDGEDMVGDMGGGSDKVRCLAGIVKRTFEENSVPKKTFF